MARSRSNSRRRSRSLSASRRPSRPRRSILDRIGRAFQRVLANPTAVVAFVVCAILAVSHTSDPAKSIVVTLGQKLQTVNALKFIGDFITEHPEQTIGAVAVSAAVLSSARRSEKFAYMIGAILVVYVLPATDAWTYGAWAAALALFLQLRTIEDRILLSVFALGVYVWTLQTQQTAPPAQ
nr:structural protein [Chronic bee paralysis virus]